MSSKKTPDARDVHKAIAEVAAGTSKQEVARALGRSTATLNRWVKDYSGLSVDEIAAELGPKTDNRYIQIMRRLFETKAPPGTTTFDWEREELSQIAKDLGIKVPSNIGDNIYAVRHGRDELPEDIKALAPKGKHWLLLPNGRGKYRFVLANHFIVEHSPYKQPIKIPDSTPQIVAENALGDEQAVLTRLRYCRLIDIFLGVAAFPLQSHLRTTVLAFDKSQIETDELYVGVDCFGAQYVVPVQAKGEDEVIGAVQCIQDIYCCEEKFSNLVARSVAAKTVNVSDDSGSEIYTIALMVVGLSKPYDVHVIREEHYQLVPSAMIDEAELRAYRQAAEQHQRAR